MPEPTLNNALLDKLRSIRDQRDDIAAQLEDPAVLSDHHRVRDLSIRKAALDPVADGLVRFDDLTRQANEHQALIDDPDSDPELVEIARAELPDLRERARAIMDDTLERLVHADDRAIGSVVLELRAGVGGDEAGLWCADLLRMYEKCAHRHAWSFEVIDHDADEGMGGVRSATVTVAGEGVWSDLSHEAGTHCVKRVPATESQGRIHTSTATVAVLPEPQAVELDLDPSDVDEHITTAQGPGGQNVNKVATAVHLIHRPTGVEVRMQETKSQQQNREKAWRLLRARLYERQLREQREAEARARNEQIGSGGRAERIRTYRYKESIAVDHRINQSVPLKDLLEGNLDTLTRQLTEHETARRIAAL
ncbi:MAG: peptide chain release factor 1 [Phycisphaerales bacterium]